MPVAWQTRKLAHLPLVVQHGVVSEHGCPLPTHPAGLGDGAGGVQTLHLKHGMSTPHFDPGGGGAPEGHGHDGAHTLPSPHGESPEHCWPRGVACVLLLLRCERQSEAVNTPNSLKLECFDSIGWVDAINASSSCSDRVCHDAGFGSARAETANATTTDRAFPTASACSK